MLVPDKDIWVTGEETLAEHLERRGVSRRSFLKFCTAMATVIAAGGISTGDAQAAGITPELIAAKLGAVKKPVLVWLQLQECTGCMESVLRSGDTTVESLILNLVSMDYNELVMAAAGDNANQNLDKANAEEHILVVNGSIPLGEDGAYTTVGGKSAEQVLRESAEKAVAIFAVGACAHWGSVQASRPNPTGAVGVDAIIKDKPVVNVAGCPPIGEVITASLVYALTYGGPPPTDRTGRPLFAYGNRIHDFCPRRARFDAGVYVQTFDDKAARDGACLYEVGCRGPETFAPCPITQWNMHTDWPIGAGHPCIGCTEPQFYDRFTPFYQVLPDVKVPGLGVEADATKVGLVALGVVGVGVAAHAGATAVWERREARAADKVNLPLLGDLPTREQSAAPLEVPETPPPAPEPPTDAATTEEQS
ncbi:MAG: hydrogenase small subunit [Candidatus Nanopelagicales bacterium]